MTVMQCNVNIVSYGGLSFRVAFSFQINPQGESEDAFFSQNRNRNRCSFFPLPCLFLFVRNNREAYRNPFISHTRTYCSSHSCKVFIWYNWHITPPAVLWHERDYWKWLWLPAQSHQHFRTTRVRTDIIKSRYPGFVNY